MCMLPRPRLDVLISCLDRSCRGLINVMTSKLRYDIIIYNFHSVISCTYVFKAFKTKLHVCKQRFRCKFWAYVFGVCLLPHEFSTIHLQDFLHCMPRSLSFTVISFTPIFMLFDLSMNKWSLICSTFLGTIILLHFTPLSYSPHLVFIS